MDYSHTSRAKFMVNSWDESAYVDIDGEGTTMGETYYPKRGLTTARAKYEYWGDMEGTGTLTYLISYMEGPAPVVGLEQFEGSIGGQDGTCVLRHVGNQDAGSVETHIEVVPGMGSGGLETLRGGADLKIAGEAEDGYDLVFSYDIG